MKIILTNNPLVFERFKDTLKIDFHAVSIKTILSLARNFVHKGHKLLSHPLAGSIKPNETLYKSIVLTNETASLDFESLSIIENSIMLTNNFIERNLEKLETAYKNDMMEMDLRLINNI